MRHRGFIAWLTAFAASTAACTTTSGTLGPPPEPTLIAHRGASVLAPEHTLAAYDLAIEIGADYLEHDLQLTFDGLLVILHDDTLDRTARGPAENCSGAVADKTLAQLETCDFGTWFTGRDPAAEIASRGSESCRSMLSSRATARASGTTSRLSSQKKHQAWRRR